jgi:hypothetical protein
VSRGLPANFHFPRSIVAWQFSRRIIFACFAADLFEILENPSAQPPPAHVSERDLLLTFRFLCTDTTIGFDRSDISLSLSLLAIELLTALISAASDGILRSPRCLQLVKNNRLLIVMYHAILKGEANVFFSSLFSGFSIIHPLQNSDPRL